MRKEVSSIKSLEYYKEKSPLLSMFLDKNMSKDRSLWLSALNERIDEEHMAEFTERFGTDWNDAVNALTLMVWNFGFQENVDIQFAADITRSVLFIGYEIGDVSGVDAILPKVCDQLKSVEKIQSDYIQWTNFLSSFDDEVLQGITLNNIEFSMTTKSFKLIGVANLRSTLLAFQNELETLPELSEITSPISNLSQPENIQFEITGVITDEIF